MEIQFADGMVYKSPHSNAPSFVKASISIKVADFVVWLQKHETTSGWVNIDVKESKGGKLYCALNDYKKEDGEKTSSEPTIECDPSLIPF